MNNKSGCVSGIPEHGIESLARCLLPEIQRYFESDEGKRAFDNWKIEQQAKAGKDSDYVK